MRIDVADYFYEFENMSHIFLKDKNENQIIGIKLDFWNQNEISIKTVQYVDTPPAYHKESIHKVNGLALQFLISFIDNALLETKKVSLNAINSEAGKKFVLKLLVHYQEQKNIVDNSPTKVEIIN